MAEAIAQLVNGITTMATCRKQSTMRATCTRLADPMELDQKQAAEQEDVDIDEVRPVAIATAGPLSSPALTLA